MHLRYIAGGDALRGAFSTCIPTALRTLVAVVSWNDNQGPEPLRRCPRKTKAVPGTLGHRNRRVLLHSFRERSRFNCYRIGDPRAFKPPPLRGLHALLAANQPDQAEAQ